MATCAGFQRLSWASVAAVRGLGENIVIEQRQLVRLCSVETCPRILVGSGFGQLAARNCPPTRELYEMEQTNVGI